MVGSGVKYMIKVAIASSDGIVVNAHFGRTPQFLIYKVSENETQFVETRKNMPGCGQLNSPKGTMEETCDLIKDCDVVLVAQIGAAMQEQLVKMGITVLKRPNMIGDALSEICFSEGVVHNVPKDLRDLLFNNKKLFEHWNALTPLARNEWICWLMSVKKAETREKHLERLSLEICEGKKRPCCWPGCSHRIVIKKQK